MNLYPVAAFLRHLLTSRSTAGHGVHSPYVYDFLTTVVRGRTELKIVSQVESLRHAMLSDKRIIRVTDLGAGSVTRAGGERSVAEIARTAAVPAKEAGLLSRMVAASTVSPARNPGSAARGHASTGSPARNPGSAARGHASTGSPARNPGSAVRGHASAGSPARNPGSAAPGTGVILELGTSLGISTLALALAAPERRVITVEGCPETAAIARENLRNHGASNATVMNLEFSTALESLRKEGLRVSFAFIDGNHRGTAIAQYITQIAGMGEEMIIVADDIHLTKDMFLAWRSLAASGIAPATMETLRLGIFFIKHGLTPGRYRIRY